MKKRDQRATSEAARPARWMTRPESASDAEARLAVLLRTGAEAQGLTPAERARVWSRLGTTDRPGRTLGALRWSAAAGVLFASAGVVAAVTARRWLEAPSTKVEPASRTAGHAPRTNHGAGRLAEATPGPDDLALPIAAVSPSSGLARPTATPAASPTAPPPPAASPTAPPPAAASPTATPPAAVLPPAAAPPPVGAAERPRVVVPRGRRSQAEPSPPTVVPEVDVAPVEPAPVPALALPPARAVAATSVTPEAVPPSALAVEAPLLGEALTRLRQQHDAGAALVALDAYDARFPRGTMHREAAIARVDALLQLGRQDDALAVLQTLALEPRAREQELRVIRGELAAPASCAAAISDFDHVLAETPAPALVERALHGRATCRARLGDTPAAARDLREYLQRFPEGRFAAEARRSLGENNL